MTSVLLQKWASAAVRAPVDRLPHARHVALEGYGTTNHVWQGCHEPPQTHTPTYDIETLVHRAPGILMHSAREIHRVLHDTYIGTGVAQPQEKSVTKKVAYSKNGTSKTVCAT